MTSELIETVEGRVATFTMNRPERRNALTGTMLEAMLDGFARVAADDDIGVVVLTGAEGAFCAGGDVKAMAEGSEFAETGLEAKAAGLRRVMETSRLLHEMPKPTIAVVPGAAAGAGLSASRSLATCASRAARRNSPPPSPASAIPAISAAATTSPVWSAPPRRASSISPPNCSTPRPRPGSAWSIAWSKTTKLESVPKPRTLADQLAAGPSIAYRYMKRNLNAAEHAALGEVLDLEAWGHTRCGGTEDHKEAAAAFVAKRAPVFKGR